VLCYSGMGSEAGPWLSLFCLIGLVRENYDPPAQTKGKVIFVKRRSFSWTSTLRNRWLATV
jgi:hypothetical protein